MALPEISLAQFNKIASGSYNAGLVDFMTDEQGNVINELTKVNNHVWKKSLNNVELKPQRILEVKETFINALKAGGVNDEKIKIIREKLGIPENLNVSADAAAKHEMLEKRFRPLTRQHVRKILDEYAASGRGYTLQSTQAVSFEEAEAAARTARMSGSAERTRKEVNRGVIDAAKGKFTTGLSDALALLSTSRSLTKLSTAIGNRHKGENAVNEANVERTGMTNRFTGLFQQALKLMDATVHETGEFTMFGIKTNIQKGEDGKLTATLTEGVTMQKVALGKTALGLLQGLMGRALVDLDTVGADNVKLMLDKVFTRDVEGFLTGEDRTSLTRQFTAMILMKKTGTANEREVDYMGIMDGAYNTGTLVDVANLALEGKVATKADLDRLHAELVKNNAGLDDTMKEMLSKVAGMPIDRVFSSEGELVKEMTVKKTIVADPQQVGNQDPIPKPPPVGVVPREELAMTAANVKDFIADFIFSDDTMVSDVVVNLPGEMTRSIFADDKKVTAFAKIIQAPEIIDTALAPEVAGLVKQGFAKMTELLAAEWSKTHNGETLDQAKAKGDFLNRFSLFMRDKNQLPGTVLAKFDSVIQNIANNGCKQIQTFINEVFQIDTNAVRNDQGGLTTEPYKNLDANQVKEQLDNKNLNQILDEAATDAASPGQVALFKQVLSDYFVNMTKSGDKRAAFAASLRYADTYNFADKEGAELQSALDKAKTKFTGAILKGTSPLLQKMMQGLPRTVLGKFAEALDDMKSRLAPIPRKIVQAHLMNIIEGSNGKIKEITLKHSLGAASVGEAFLCTFKYVENGEEKTTDAVVKIMRHDAEEKVKREAEVFTAAAAKIGPGMLKTWQGQLEQYMTEFDFTNEARNVLTGSGLYEVEGNANHPYRAVAPNVRSMKISPLVAPSKNVMVCTLADGMTADKFFGVMRQSVQRSLAPLFERDPVTGRLKWDAQTRLPVFKQGVGSGSLHEARIFCAFEYGRLEKTQKMLQQAASVWFSEALLGSGKFHGDAHAGNLMVTDNGEHVTFIDFGNLYELKTHYVTDQQGNIVTDRVLQQNANGQVEMVDRPRVRLDERVELLRLILGATLRDKDFFMQGFERLLSADGKAAFQANKAKVAAILDSVLVKGEFSFDVCYRLQGALSELQKLGLELPPQINCFVQSMTRFQNTIAEMNAILNQVRAVMTALKEGPAEANLVETDPLDLFAQNIHFASTAEGKQIVQVENPDYDEAASEEDEDSQQFFELPRHVEQLIDYGDLGGPLMQKDGAYQTQLRTSMNNAADKPAEARRICELMKRHLDPVNMAQLRGNLDGMADSFNTEWKAADTDEKKTAAINSFAYKYANAVRQQMSAQLDSAKKLYGGKFNVPNSFAKVVMGALFNGADAANRMFDENFSAIDKLKIGNDTRKVATDELNVSTGSLIKGALPDWLRGDAPTADALIMNAIVRDTERMGGDKSYQIDIGI